MTVFEGENCTIFRNHDFLFGDATPDADLQLPVGEGQWVYTLNGDQYYLPESKRHYPLSFFQSITTEQKMTKSVSQCTKSVHVRILTYNEFNRSRPP